MKIKIPFKLLSLQGDGYHLLIKVKLNNKVANMLIDTGASRTIFDKKKIKKYVKAGELRAHDSHASGLGTNKMETFICTIDSFKIGTLQIKNYETGILDISHVNTSYKLLKLKPIDGVIGSDLLKKYKAVIDYEEKTLTLHSKVNA